MLASKIHKLPPRIPVYSYHWIRKTSLLNTFPKINQGHESCQLRWKYSIEIQTVINKKNDNLLEITFLENWKIQKTNVIISEFTIKAKIEPPGEAFQIQYVVNTLKRKKEKKKNLKAENELKPFLRIISDIINKGMNAKKIKKLSPLSGQEMNNKIPVNEDNKSFFICS